MVLGRIVHVALAVVVLAGCKQSLFDNHGGDDTTTSDGNTDSDGMVQSSCGANCLGDVAADFCGTKWQCLDDHRDRTWAAMTASSGAYVGANGANKIAKGSDSLLVSTAGNSDPADPAVAFTSSSNQVIKLTISVEIPAGAADQTVRLYRNSREDVLYTQSGAGGVTVQTSLTVDALTNDRFLLAIAPTAAGATDVKVQFFVNATSTSFPAECQMALEFEGVAAGAMTVANACGVAFASRDYNAGTPIDAVVATAQGPFAELGMAGDLSIDHYYKGTDIMDRTGDTTTQFWLRHDAFGTENTVMFSDDDLDKPGGLAVYRLMSNSHIGAETCINNMTFESAYSDAAYPAPDTGWHFVRVVQAGNSVKLCVDGTKLASYVLPAGQMQSGYPPFVGKNVTWTPSGAYLDGAVDDVRVLKGALPCN